MGRQTGFWSFVHIGLRYQEPAIHSPLMKDPLFVCTPKIACPKCKGDRDRYLRRGCKDCCGSGYQAINLNGWWAPSPAFLVCGGPSLLKQPFEKLRERGIASLAVNQVAAKVPVTAWTFGDPADKFHHGLHLDPKTITFAPLGKLRHPINAKLPDGQFRRIGLHNDNGEVVPYCLRDCPSTFGYSRDSRFDPATFLTTDYAHWGGATKEDEVRQAEWDARFEEVWKKHTQESGGHFSRHQKNLFKKEYEKKVGKSPPNSHVLCSMLLGFRLLHYLGCPRIYLMGVDLWMTDEQPYAFTQGKSARNGRYSDENEMLHQIKPVLEASGMEVYNTNPTSKCDAFQFVKFEEALQDCRGAVPLEPFDTDKWYDKSFAEQNIKDHKDPVPVERVAAMQRAMQRSVQGTKH